MIKKLAVIGKDVSKSISPQIHTFIASKLNLPVSYEKISVPEEEFEACIDGLLQAYYGVNVTIPYKISIIPHLNKVVGDAKVFGAVNTVSTNNLTGDNTDGLGFMLMLTNEGVEVKGKKVLLLGAGGAGRSVAKKLIDAGAILSVYDKNYENCLALFNEFGANPLREVKDESYYLIVNATGVGMHKTEGVSPVSESLIELCIVAVDLIYTPPKSKFLQIADGCNKQIINGEAMLFYQAYYADCIFFGLEPDAKLAKELFNEFLTEGI